MVRALVVVLLAGCGEPTGGPPVDSGPVDATAQRKLVAYVSGGGPDLAWFDVAATGALARAGARASFAANPSFLASDAGATALFAVSEATSRVGAYAIDPTTGALGFVNDVAAGGSGPAHVSVDRTGRYVFVANYGDGTISVLPIGPGHRLGAPTQTVVAGANAHMIVADPSNRFVLVPCLGSDHVAQYLFDATTGTLTPNAVPRVTTAAGAGPRHLAFMPDASSVYLINEKDSTMTAFAFDSATGQLTARQTISTRAAGATGTNTTAEVWVDPAGRFVYGSNRGDDDIVQYAIDRATGRLALVGHTKTGGKTPRDFTIDPAGRFLYAANQASGTVTTFAIDPVTGTLSPTGASITAPSPAFVGIVGLPAP